MKEQSIEVVRSKENVNVEGEEAIKDVSPQPDWQRVEKDQPKSSARKDEPVEDVSPQTVNSYNGPLPAPLPAPTRTVAEPGAYAVVNLLPNPPARALNAASDENVHSTAQSGAAEDEDVASDLEGGVLPQAEPVSNPTEVAEPFERGDVRKRLQRPCFIALFLLAVIVLVLLVIVLVLLSNDNDDLVASLSPNQETTVAPSDTNQALFSMLPNYTMDALREAFDNPSNGATSAQYRAFQWLEQDPWLPTYTEARFKQRFALATFFYATVGTDWNHTGGDSATVVHPFQRPHGEPRNITSEEWLSYPSDECLWFSMADLRGKKVCLRNEDDNSSHYSYLDLGGNKLRGSIPGEIAMLSNLKNILLVQNGIGGAIPTQIGLLSKLQFLSLGKNSFSGFVPSEIGLLANTLQVVNLRMNQLTGIPVEFWQLSKLENVTLTHNQFKTPLPSDLGKLLPKLKRFTMTNNELTGPIPDNFHSTPNLRKCNCSVA